MRSSEWFLHSCDREMLGLLPWKAVSLEGDPVNVTNSDFGCFPSIWLQFHKDKIFLQNITFCHNVCYFYCFAFNIITRLLSLILTHLFLLWESSLKLFGNCNQDDVFKNINWNKVIPLLKSLQWLFILFRVTWQNFQHGPKTAMWSFLTFLFCGWGGGLGILKVLF